MDENKTYGTRLARLWKLFLSTLYISSFTFGGGFVIVTFMKKKFVDELHWIDEQEMLYLTYAVAAVMVIISALQIYIKMNTGEDGVTKSILTLIGACLFMIGASILFPAFFGYQI